MTALLETTTQGDIIYLQELLTQLTATTTTPELNQLRCQASTELAATRIPHKYDEDWRFTDLSELTSLSFQLASPVALSTQILDQFRLVEADQSRIVFVNGVYCSEFSDLSALPQGVYVGNFEGLNDSKKEEFVKYLHRHQSKREVFGLLNTAGLSDLGIIWTEKNVVVEKPIHLLHLSVPTESPIFAQPRTSAIAETGSQLDLVEYYGAVASNCSDLPQNLPYFNNVVTDIFLEENAQINHSRIQRESGDGFHIANTIIEQARNSNYKLAEISFGAKLSRHNLLVLQTGEQTETNLNGLTMIGNKQVSDTHSIVSLHHPYGTINQVHKCLIDQQAHAVFNGKILVPQKAQLTNASQLNRNLLLSPQARVNTKPELQITADNVKCTHGATVSQLETDEIFYLRSRGLSEFDARHLLIDAFAAEILDSLFLPSLRKRLSQCVACRNNY